MIRNEERLFHAHRPSVNLIESVDMEEPGMVCTFSHISSSS